MLLKTIIILLTFVPFRIFSTDTLCRLIELNVPQGSFEFDANQLEDRLFYKTDRICRNKPVFRSLKYQHLYQFQAPNNRWWILYNTKNSTYQLGMYEWCDAWDFRPLLAMPLGTFQHPLEKPIKSQRWKHVVVHEKNQSYSYRPVSNVSLKCYHSPSTLSCQTHRLTFLFDLTESTAKYEFYQMKLLAKSLMWLLYNQTKLALTYYSDTFHILNSFDESTAARSLEHLFDSLDSMDRSFGIRRQFSIPWVETIHSVVTRIFKRRFVLPVVINTATQESQSTMNSTNGDENNNDDDDTDVYTDPYPLVYFDEHAIKTVLNITTYEYRRKRSIHNIYEQSKHVLAIFTSRSKLLYDYMEQDRNLAKFIATVPLRILVVDFNSLSNKKSAEYTHSAFVHNSKYALVSSPVIYNYIETYEESGDTIHGDQLFDDYHRLCNPAEETFLKVNFTSKLLEMSENSQLDCTLLTLLHNGNHNVTLKEKFDYTFYETPDRCFSAPVYRSLGDRNLYAQRISTGQWVIVRVDSLLPSTWIQQRKLASQTTSTLSPEFLHATDYANGPMMEEYTVDNVAVDLPTSIPHCTDTPGIDTLWQSVDSQLLVNDYSLKTSRQWTSPLTQSSNMSPMCNKYKISCQNTKFDLMVVIDAQQEYVMLIQTLFNVLLSLIDSYGHRFSLVVLSSATIDTLQYHVPLTTMSSINTKLIENFLIYTDSKNTSTVQLSQHLERVSQYLTKNQEAQFEQILLTITSRFDFKQSDTKDIIQRFPSIRYMVLDPTLKLDDEHSSKNNQQRAKLLSALTSFPSYSNLFWPFAAYRDIVFNTVFRLLENLCGHLQ